MVMDLRQVMAGILTFSMFVMLGNMIKRDHIDPLLEPVPVSPDQLNYNTIMNSKPGLYKLEISYGPWKDHQAPGKPCWIKPSLKGKDQTNGYIFFSLSNGPEYHASQVANAITVARYLGATLALPDIKGTKLAEKRKFEELYNVDKFITSLEGVVRVDENPPAELSNGKLHTVRVPNRVSQDFIASNIKPIFESKRNLKILTHFNTPIASKGKQNKLSNAVQCMTMFESLKLNSELQELVDSMVGMLRSLSQRPRGRFLALDLRNEMLDSMGCQRTNGTYEKKCYNAKEVAEFLEKMGFKKHTTIYLTQTEWHPSFNALRDVFPNTFTKGVIMPADMKAKFMDSETHKYDKIIDYYMCSQGDIFVPAVPSRFYASVVGERIAQGKTQVLVPSNKTSTADSDYVSPYIARKSHFAHSCFC